MNPSDLDKVKTKLPLSASTLARNLPPPVTADACGELVRSPARAGDVGPESGSNSNARVAAKQSKRIRQSSKPLLNKLEQEWYDTLRGKFPDVTIWKQALKWRIGNGIVYTPDFVAFLYHDHHDGLTCWEVKGPHAFRGGFENLKVAASLYPEVRWVLVWKEAGVWREQEVLP